MTAAPTAADTFRRLLDAAAHVSTLVADAEAPTRQGVQSALTEMLDAYRTAVAGGARDGEAGDLAARYRALYTRGLLLLDTDRPTVAALRESLLALVSALDADAGALVVLGPDGGFERIIAHDVDSDEVRAVAEGVIGRVRTLGAGVNIERVADHASLAAQTSVIRAGLHAALCVPILSRGAVWGAAYLDRRRTGGRPFSAADLDVLGAFAQQAGAALRLAHRLDRLQEETATLRARVESRLAADDLIGRSKPMLRLLDQLGAVADTDATVLLTGESGTGKELLARALHASSRRKSGPFVAVNCGAIPEPLLESTLFGHKKGSFTGAVASETGVIEAARGGTLFLDEVGDMPLALQVKLLRVLQSGAYTRVGDAEERRADVRWVAATHRDLPEAIKAGRFREDLYYRLCVFDLHAPPLRERPDDLALLADHFVRRFAQTYDRPARHFSADALAAMEAYAWPGNVRELENVVQRAVILSEGPTLHLSALPLALAGAAPEHPGAADDDEADPASGFHAAVRAHKKWLLRDALGKAAGSRKGAADALGLNRTYLSRLLRQLDLQDVGAED